MDKPTALKMRDYALRAADCMVKCSDIANAKLPEDEAKELQKRAGRVLSSIYEEILLPLFREHPNTIPEEIRDATRRRLGLAD